MGQESERLDVMVLRGGRTAPLRCAAANQYANMTAARPRVNQLPRQVGPTIWRGGARPPESPHASSPVSGVMAGLAAGDITRMKSFQTAPEPKNSLFNKARTQGKLLPARSWQEARARQQGGCTDDDFSRSRPNPHHRVPHVPGTRRGRRTPVRSGRANHARFAAATWPAAIASTIFWRCG